MPLVLEIVTPEARVFSDTVDSVVVPTVNGELGILPGHIPLLSQVADGELRIQRGARIEELIVGAGFVQVQGAQDALRNADGLDPTEVERLEGVVRFAVAQLASRKRR
jgi:F-type H+-transporting ATPase subunit epsilon